MRLFTEKGGLVDALGAQAEGAFDAALGRMRDWSK